ncbi:hypothetical protein [Neptunomonas antarctica]|uniref:PilZ domain-containing protein n=1 Tax=Neptunomonas antarctica TaxID=619304 RepID=A0A1N7M8A1_9GAMM|nr:hypothetical protein [Neptunomonas antarctica]SIS82346.1 hypothetical protein SAMN05421760_105261 [Neptunomonas antarctica]
MASNLNLMQGYIRHPHDIPAQISLCSQATISSNTANRSGKIGISVSTDNFYAIGTTLTIEISVKDPGFRASGHATWCIPEKNGRFRTGLVFDDPDTAYAVRMIEQICHIEQYRKEMEKMEGRVLTPEDAADEWINLFAKDFPELGPPIHS